jgi:murein DD-endopeptidase MepM/ murein hydrolase activator NlpD
MVGPIAGAVVTTKYRETNGPWAAGYHTGRDYRARTPLRVNATAAGKVVHAGRGGWGPSYGIHVIIETNRVRHLYGHLSKTSVSVGKQVTAGQQIGVSGATGKVKGAHLHYEERVLPYRYGRNDREPKFDENVGKMEAPLPSARKPTVFWRKLSFGMRDSDSVRELQKRLNVVVKAGLPITGNYLAQTRDAVKKFQVRQGWKGKAADGLMYDPATRAGGKVTTQRLFPSTRYNVRFDAP